MRHLPWIALLVAGACQMPPPNTSAAAKQAIDAANATWPRLTSTGHADSLAELYQTNAIIMPPNMAPTRGKEAIRAFFATMNAVKPTLTLSADSVFGSGNSAVEVGRWHFTFPAGAALPPGTPMADSGKYVVRWVNENGRWLMAQDIWNSDVAPPTASAPAPAGRTGRR